MSIKGIHKRNLNQKAIYWGSPVEDGKGSKTFATPVEIKCRWEYKREVFKNGLGVEELSTAIVYVDRDVDEQGYLCLSPISALNGETPGPYAVIDSAYSLDAYEIMSMEKTGNLKNNTFIRKVYMKRRA